jgi:iron-sulfur cluster repair protein YtfE (RIC family)
LDQYNAQKETFTHKIIEYEEKLKDELEFRRQLETQMEYATLERNRYMEQCDALQTNLDNERKEPGKKLREMIQLTKQVVEKYYESETGLFKSFNRSLFLDIH